MYVWLAIWCMLWLYGVCYDSMILCMVWLCDMWYVYIVRCMAILYGCMIYGMGVYCLVRLYVIWYVYDMCYGSMAYHMSVCYMM